ncbi:competence type IV pilus minor pilin ComGG [Lentibacillus saliphilus]|uniref:competence type IV pilus minor pilin ComGG n=1 Tax=Lentibacillus saliphilus TaxID=2737028 RepID=UPI001C310E49|nr:competence type IV pilus minor pilin ComGG [Lentibacillus saliphilus]
MQRKLSFIKLQSGFVLPYVLFGAAIVLLVLSSSIQLYQNEIQITELELEHIKIETLFQMGYSTYLANRQEDSWPNSASYSFPQGDVEIVYVEEGASIYMTITTDSQITRSFVVSLKRHLLRLSQNHH